MGACRVREPAKSGGGCGVCWCHGLRYGMTLNHLGKTVIHSREEASWGWRKSSLNRGWGILFSWVRTCNTAALSNGREQVLGRGNTKQERDAGTSDSNGFAPMCLKQPQLPGPFPGDSNLSLHSSISQFTEENIGSLFKDNITALLLNFKAWKWQAYKSPFVDCPGYKEHKKLVLEVVSSDGFVKQLMGKSGKG